MKEFILANWYYLALLCLALINTIIILCKKNKVVQKDTIFEQLLERLPVMIRNAEQKGLSGAEKKQVVMTYALKWLADLTGDDVQVYYGRVSDAIESILSTPEKKGVFIDE